VFEAQTEDADALGNTPTAHWFHDEHVKYSATIDTHESPGKYFGPSA